MVGGPDVLESFGENPCRNLRVRADCAGMVSAFGRICLFCKFFCDAGGDVAHAFVGEVEFFLAEVHVALALQGNEVDVGVRNFESQYGHAHFAAGNGAAHGACHACGEDVERGEFLVVEVEDVVDFAAGNDEGVALGHGVDVEKGVEALVLGALVGGNFALGDA